MIMRGKKVQMYNFQYKKGQKELSLKLTSKHVSGRLKGKMMVCFAASKQWNFLYVTHEGSSASAADYHKPGFL